jgi:hypothetical protein
MELVEYHYVYYSYEEYGRGYIGSRTCKCLPEKDVKYFGSYKDKKFKPIPWNKGIKDINVSGGKNPRAKKILYNDKVYDCIKDAMKINNASRYYILKNSIFIN